MKKRIFTFLLALVMLVGYLPLSAIHTHAIEEETIVPAQEEQTVGSANEIENRLVEDAILPTDDDFLENGITETWESEENYVVEKLFRQEALYAATQMSYAPYAKVEYSYSESVKTGTIRYIHQIVGGGYYNKNYWQEWETKRIPNLYYGPNSECGTSCISMALSYIGVNKTPKNILDRGEGSTLFGENWGGAKSSSCTYDKLATLVENYVNGNGKYSPPIIHLNQYSSAGHFVMILGRISSNTYQVLDPASAKLWTIKINGSVATYNHPNGGATITDSINYKLWNGNERYDDCYQYYNPNATICNEHKYNDVGICECGYKYPWTLDASAAGVYSVTKGFTPRLGGPYDAETKDTKTFKAGDKVTVFGKLKNGKKTDGVDHIWYQIGYGNGTVGYVYNTYLKKDSGPLAVSYNANGGSGAPGSQTKVYGTTLKLSSTKPTRSGYTFLGWATSSSATSATYAAGANYTNNKSVTLYAVWQKDVVKYTVTYHPNGGTCSTPGTTVQQGKTIGSLPTASMTDMSFEGWYTQPYGGSKITTSTAINSNMTVYAHYAYAYGTKVKLEFDPNGGTLPGMVGSRNISAINVFRSHNMLVVYNEGGKTTDQNIYGAEVAVESSGKVIAYRKYGDTTQLVVPEGGFILSGVATWNEETGKHFDGFSFVNAIGELEGAYVSLDYETGTVAYFDSCAGYLAATKMGQERTRYGALPVPERSGYVFDGWTVNGSPVSYYSGFAGYNLVASWTEEKSIRPAAQMTYNGHLYERYDSIVSWTKAKALCEAKGGHLVTITDAAEQKEVSAFAAKGNRGSYKIGATDEGTEGTWRWVTGEKFSYNKWDPQAPEPSNGSGENYAAIIAIECAPNKQVGEWNDIRNTDYARVEEFYDLSNTGFICEYDNICEHSYSSKVTTAATCEKSGVKTYTCNKCDDSYTETIAATGHSYSSKVTTAATCEKKGVKTYTCSKCSNSYTEAIAATGHKYTSKVISATCLEYEKVRYTCENCGHYYDELSAPVMSGWSPNKPVGVDASQIETRMEYRYRTKSYTTSSNSALSGWTQDGSTTQWGAYGNWSSWSDTAVSANDSRQVETRTVYGYYYYKCAKCGAHMHGYGTCWTWCGGCGATTSSSGWTPIWSTTSWSNANLKDWHGTGKYYTYLNGELVFKWTDGGSKTQYRYRTREKETIYSFYQWSDWTDWSSTPVSANSDRDVESRTVYRYVVPKQGDHKYTSVTTAPTCTKNGYTTYTCSVCGDSYQDNEKSALGHTEVTVAGKAATCTEAGKTDGKKCSVCGTVTVAQQTIKARGHTWDDTTYKWNSDYSKCTATRTCTADAAHKETKTVKSTSSVKTPATCQKKGTTTYTATFGVSWAATQTKNVQNIPVLSEHSFVNGECQYCGETQGLRGDLDNNNSVDDEDVIYLLWHTLMPKDYPVNQNVDYDRNGIVDDEDVIYLLWHTLMPDEYPL